MGMDIDAGGGGKRKVKPEMNVAPLVDIVLVLLIIFMVIAPVVTKGMYVILPPEPEDKPPPPSTEQPNTVTMTIRNDGRILLNVQHEYANLDEARATLPADLLKMLNDTPSRKLYVNAEDEVEYGMVVKVMDLAQQSAPNSITLLTEPLKL